MVHLRSVLFRCSRAALAGALLGVAVAAQGSIRRAQAPAPESPRLVCEEATRIADPKLDGGEARLAFRLLPAGASTYAVAEVRANGALVDTLWSGTLVGGAAATEVAWDGRELEGLRAPTGAYTLRVAAVGLPALERPLDLVRLGVTEIEAQDSPAGDDEFQMVYFRKGSTYAFYATPAIHEFVSVAAAGEVSDLDGDDGEPRPIPAVHVGTASPVLVGSNYATTAYNYPLAYSKGATPQLELTFGASATDAAGAPMGVGYPVAGCELRVVCDQGVARMDADLVTPGGTAIVDLEPLSEEVERIDLGLTLRWQVRLDGEVVWREIHGAQTIPLRFYTLLSAPKFAAGQSGTQYSGPWVEVAEYVASWKDTLGLAAADQQGLTEVFVKGFFGQNGGIPAAIEGVVYDAFPLGGDGGATHYLEFGSWRMNLSRLLNAHAQGRYVNCSDNMGAATTMLSMMGAASMRPVRLGTMNLRALWGIGAPGYTLDLWGGSHGFSYHHIVTDDGATSVSDTCMQLDDDGNPDALPSTVAWNVRRPWLGTGGYRTLAASNAVTKTLETLPGLL